MQSKFPLIISGENKHLSGIHYRVFYQENNFPIGYSQLYFYHLQSLPVELFLDGSLTKKEKVGNISEFFPYNKGKLRKKGGGLYLLERMIKDTVNYNVDVLYCITHIQEMQEFLHKFDFENPMDCFYIKKLQPQ